MPKKAVIDIGSNSVRLVVYDNVDISPNIIFSEKMICRLGLDIDKEKKLNPFGMKKAEIALGRFIALIRNLFIGESDITIFATAAVRLASDGMKFIQDMEEKYLIRIRLLSGIEEGRYSGIGVRESFYHPKGIVMDLGGGSTELVHLEDNGNISKEISLLVGSLSKDSYFDIKANVQKVIKKANYKDLDYCDNLYAVGGGIRSIAKVHMMLTGYNMKIMHGYEMSIISAKKTVNCILNSKIDAMEKWGILNSRRLNTIKSSACILSAILSIVKVNRLIISTHGIRDGIIHNDCGSLLLYGDDKLFSRCRFLISSDDRFSEKKMYSWIIAVVNILQDNLLKYSIVKNSIHRICYAACILSDFSVDRHDNLRASYAFESIIDYPLVSINHHEKIFLSLILYFRYKRVLHRDLKVLAKCYLNDLDIKAAKIIGCFLRLSYNLTVGNRELLDKIIINISDISFNILVPKDMEEILYGQFVNDLCNNIADLLDISYTYDVY